MSLPVNPYTDETNPFRNENSAKQWLQTDLPKSITRPEYDRLRSLARHLIGHGVIGEGRIRSSVGMEIEYKLAKYQAAIEKDQSDKAKVQNKKVSGVFQQQHASSGSSSSAAAAAAAHHAQPPREALFDDGLTLEQWLQEPLPKIITLENYNILADRIRPIKQRLPDEDRYRINERLHKLYRLIPQAPKPSSSAAAAAAAAHHAQPLREALFGENLTLEDWLALPLPENLDITTYSSIDFLIFTKMDKAIPQKLRQDVEQKLMTLYNKAVQDCDKKRAFGTLSLKEEKILTFLKGRNRPLAEPAPASSSAVNMQPPAQQQSSSGQKPTLQKPVPPAQRLPESS